MNDTISDNFEDDELKELYQSMVLQHSQKPLNFGVLENVTPIKGKNPSCGDNIDLYVSTNNDKFDDIKFTGSGCALCIASASLMTSMLKGKSIKEGSQVFSQFTDLIQGNKNTMDNPEYQKLEIFNHVHHFPLRAKCAMLAWRALEKTFKE